MSESAKLQAPVSVSEELRRHLSKKAKERGLGGYIQGGGRGKKGRYRGYWCDSSWELAWIMYHLDHDVPFERNNERFDYEFEGRSRYWVPDFKLKDGTYVEVKGYVSDQVLAKISSFTLPLLLVGKEEMAPIFEYVRVNYGKDYIRLYD